MLCHGELVRLRPQPRYLTSFYLMISAGGALGGLSVSVIAPQVFNTYAEWKIGLVAGFVLAATVAFLLAGSTGSVLTGWNGPRRLRPSLARHAAGRWPSGGCYWRWWRSFHLLRNDALAEYPILEQTRNFYGVLTVADDPPKPPPRALQRRHAARSAIHAIRACTWSLRLIIRREVASARRSSITSMNPRARIIRFAWELSAWE